VQTIEGLNRKIDQPDTMFGTPIIDLTFSNIATSTIKTNIYAKDVF
jgi:hypothetical protein